MGIEGFLEKNHPLSIRNALSSLDSKIKTIANYSPEDLWDQDTNTLPPLLRRYRKQIRDFANTTVKPYVMDLDLHPHGEGEKIIIEKAARKGYFSDLLPVPFGSNNPLNVHFPLQLMQSIKLEELAAACGGVAVIMGAHGLGTIPVILSGRMSCIFKFVVPMYVKNFAGKPYIMAFAITEPGAGSDAEDSDGAYHYKPGVVAKRANGGWLLNGTKVFISGGDIASGVTVFAALEKEGMESWTCFFADKTMKGFSVGRKELKMGQRASAAAELIFEDVFIPDSNVIGKVRQGWAINRATLNFSRIPVGSIALGIARGAMESAIDFVCKNSLGNKTLINYQEIQLSIAQMIIDTYAMRSTIWQATKVWTPTQARAAIAKTFCSDTAMKVCDAAMEIMGNHGWLHNNNAEKCYRDARLTQIYEGTNQINRLGIIEDQIERFESKIK